MAVENDGLHRPAQWIRQLLACCRTLRHRIFLHQFFIPLFTSYLLRCGRHDFLQSSSLHRPPPHLKRERRKTSSHLYAGARRRSAKSFRRGASQQAMFTSFLLDESYSMKDQQGLASDRRRETPTMRPQLLFCSYYFCWFLKLCILLLFPVTEWTCMHEDVSACVCG